MSWLKPEIDSRPTLKDSPCQDCCDLDSLCKELLQNFSLLAETGYAEGVMCHTLVKVRNSSLQKELIYDCELTLDQKEILWKEGMGWDGNDGVERSLIPEVVNQESKFVIWTELARINQINY